MGWDEVKWARLWMEQKHQHRSIRWDEQLVSMLSNCNHHAIYIFYFNFLMFFLLDHCYYYNIRYIECFVIFSKFLIHLDFEFVHGFVLIGLYNCLYVKMGQKHICLSTQSMGNVNWIECPLQLNAKHSHLKLFCDCLNNCKCHNLAELKNKTGHIIQPAIAIWHYNLAQASKSKQ